MLTFWSTTTKVLLMNDAANTHTANSIDTANNNINTPAATEEEKRERAIARIAEAFENGTINEDVYNAIMEEELGR